MGMFDTIDATAYADKLPMPKDPKWKKLRLDDMQTKDLPDMMLTLYRLTAAGVLEKPTIASYIDHDDCPDLKPPEERVYTRVIYSGAVWFYTFFDDMVGGHNDYWLEFKALFHNGQLLVIERTSPVGAE